MFSKRLSQEAIALIHHIEINQTDWWTNVVERFVLCVIWIHELAPFSVIEKALRTECHMNLSKEQLLEIVDKLKASGTIIHSSKDELQLSEVAKISFEEELSCIQKLSDQARDKFIEAVKSVCPTLDPNQTWVLFNTQFLMPFVKEVGAQVYYILSGRANGLPKTESLQKFLDQFPETCKESLENAISLYLSSKNVEVKKYVYRYLKAYFLIEASHISKTALKRLMQTTAKPPNFCIYADTNFLFSLLNLHSSHANLAANLVREQLQQVTDLGKLEFRVLDRTIIEAKNVLGWHLDHLKNTRFNDVLAQVAAEDTTISAITRKYVERCYELGSAIDAEDYFLPYIDNLETILNEKGILIDNGSDAYAVKQEVVDDIHNRREFEINKYGDEAKSYNAIQHDMILWHYVKNKRQASFQSPLEAEYWIITIDYRFLGIDSFKSGYFCPVCLHPTALIQLLQFWVGYTPDFEGAVIDGLKTFLMDYDIDDEKVTLRILESISRYDKDDVLSADTIKKVLMNKALRQKIKAKPGVQEQINLVRDAIIEENQRIAEELSKKAEENERLQTRMNETQNQVINKEDTILEKDKIIRQKDDEIERLRARAIATDAETEAMKTIIARKEEEEQKRLRAKEKNRRIRDFCIFWLIIPTCLALIIVNLLSNVFLLNFKQYLLPFLPVNVKEYLKDSLMVNIFGTVLFTVFTFLWVPFIVKKFRDDSILTRTSLFIFLVKTKKWVGFVVALVLAMLNAFVIIISAVEHAIKISTKLN